MIIVSDDIVKKPVVSVLIFTYNQEKYITQAIESVLSQETDFLFEIIINDDCSTDATPTICKLYQQRHPSLIKLLLQENNLGIVACYKNAIPQTQGKYIAWLAGDDFWTLDSKLQMQKDYLDAHSECSLCYTNIDTCDEKGNLLKKKSLPVDKLPKSFEEHLMAKGFIAPLTWMYRKEVAERYDVRGAETDESFGVALDAFALGQVDYIDVVSATYRMLRGTLSRPITNEKWYTQYLGVFRSQQFYCDRYKVGEEIRRRVKVNSYIELLSYAVSCQDKAFVEEATEYFDLIGYNIRPFIKVCEGKLRKETELRRVKGSYAYKLGKTLLKPFGWLRTKK